MSSAGVVVTQLIVDASGAKQGVEDFKASMAKAKQSAEDTGKATGSSFEAAQKKWINSLAATDPVIKAQIKMQQDLDKQQQINNRGLELGTMSQRAAEMQMERVRQKHIELVDAAKKNGVGWQDLLGIGGLVERLFVRMAVAMAAREFYQFGKLVFDQAAALDEQAQQAGVSTAALQAYRAQLVTNGISAEQTDQMITRLTRSIGTAIATSGPARDAFNQMGISLQTLKGGAEATLPAVAQALLNIQDPARRAALEVDLFSRSGQRLESALHDLVDPTKTLIEKQTALGQIMGTDLTVAADKASDSLTKSWNAFKVSVTPAVVEFVGWITKLVDKMNELSQMQAHDFGAATLPGQAGDSRAGAVAKTIFDTDPSQILINGRKASNDNGFSTTAMDKYIAQQRLSADLAGLSAQRRAEEEASISAANAKLEDGAATLYNQDGTVRKFVTSYKEAVGVIGQATSKEVEGLAATIARGKAWDKVRETVDQYLQQINAEADAAGKSSLQRSIETDIIKAGEISQKSRGVIEKDVNKTLAGNTKELGQQRVDAIAATEARKILAPIELQIANNLQLAGVALSTNRDERQLALQIAQQELQTGAKLKDIDIERLKLTQQKNDKAQLKDYLEDLKQEVSLAGLSADERERELAVIQAIHANHGVLDQDIQNEIRGHIAARQEMERQRQLVDGISSSFQDFFTNVLDTSKASFSSLWDAIKHQFNQMLAYMAAQALISPIIIPMVQAMGFGGGLTGGNPLASMTTGGGGLSSLLGGGSSFSLSGIGSYGAGSLSAIFGGGAGEALGGGDFIGTAGSGMTSVLGGLGPILGGAGLGSLASSLIFGNKNSAGIGGMGGALAGAAIGSIIPGVGTIIGGLIGGLAGGGLGSMTGTSNQGAISNFTNGGLGNTLFKAGGGNNSASATGAAQKVNDALKALKDAGVDVSLGNITGLSIGSDKSYIYDSAGGKQKLAGGDIEGVVKGILDRILPSATGTDDTTNSILQKYRDQGGINSGNITQLAQEIQQAQQAKTAADTAAADLQKQVADFGPAIAAALKKITDPEGAAFDDIVKAQKARVAQAIALGVDANQLTALSDAEINQFLKGLSAQQLHGLIAANDITGSIADQAQALADAADAAQAAADAATQATKDLSAGFKNLSGDIKDLVSQAQDAARTASQTAQSWGNAHDALSKASTALLISDPSLSPTDLYRNTRSQFDSLALQARRDPQAANDLAGFASQFLQTSLQFNGSTTAFTADRSYINSTLSDLTGFSKSQQDIAQQQADSMAAAVTLLQSIADNTTNAATSDDLQELRAEVAGLTTQVKNVGLFNRTMASV